MWNRWSKVDWGEKVIIVMIGLEIVLSLATIWITISDSRSQNTLLSQNLAAERRVNTDLGELDSKLKSINTAMGKTAESAQRSAAISGDIFNGLDSQLRILTRQQQTVREQARLLTQQLTVQKEQWKKLNQRPALLVTTLIGPRIHPTWRRLSPDLILSTGRMLGRSGQSLWFKFFAIRNIGNTSVIKPSVTAHVVAPAHFECTRYIFPAPISTENPCAVEGFPPPNLKPDADLNQQGKKTDLSVWVYFTMPQNMEHLTIYFTVSGDNLPGDTYLVTANR